MYHGLATHHPRPSSIAHISKLASLQLIFCTIDRPAMPYITPIQQHTDLLRYHWYPMYHSSAAHPQCSPNSIAHRSGQLVTLQLVLTILTHRLPMPYITQMHQRTKLTCYITIGIHTPLIGRPSPTAPTFESTLISQLYISIGHSIAH